MKHLPLPIVARHSGSSRLVGSYRLVLSTVPGRWRNVAERTGVPLRASCSHSHQGLQTGYPLTWSTCIMYTVVVFLVLNYQKVVGGSIKLLWYSSSSKKSRKKEFLKCQGTVRYIPAMKKYYWHVLLRSLSLSLSQNVNTISTDLCMCETEPDLTIPANRRLEFEASSSSSSSSWTASWAGSLASLSYSTC